MCLTQHDVHFFFHAMGAERDAYVAVDVSLVLKLHPVRASLQASTNYLEFITVDSEKVLPLPACYGHFVLDIGGVVVQALLCERIAFTMLEFQNAVCGSKPTGANVQVFSVLCKKALGEMVRCSRDRGYHLYDWHFGNLAFADASDANLILIDWQSNGPARPGTKLRERMAQPYQGLRSRFQCWQLRDL